MAEPRGSSDAARSPAGEAPVVRLSEASWGDIYDDLIISALRQPFSKDRALLVSVEQELRCLLSDPNLTQVPFERFGPLNSFQRLLLHRLGDAYKVKRVMAPLAAPSAPESTSGPQPPATTMHLVLAKVPESICPMVPLSDIITKFDAERPSLPPVFTQPGTNSSSACGTPSGLGHSAASSLIEDSSPSVRIMSRQRDSSAPTSSATSGTSSTSGKGKRTNKTLEERAAEYQQARERIFNEEARHAPLPTVQAPSPSISRTSSDSRRSRELAAAPHSARLRPSAPAFDPTGGSSGFVFYPPTPSTHLPPPPEGYEYPPSPPLDPEEQQADVYDYLRDPNLALGTPSQAVPQGYYVVPAPPPQHHYPPLPAEMQQGQPAYHYYVQTSPLHDHHAHQQQSPYPGYYVYPSHHPGHVPQQPSGQVPQQPINYYGVPPGHAPPPTPQLVQPPPQPIEPQHTAQSSTSHSRNAPFPPSDSGSTVSSAATTADHAIVGYELRPSSSSSSINSHPSLNSIPTSTSLGHPLVARAASEISAASSSVSSTGSSRTSRTAASSYSSSSKPISLGPGLPPLGSMKENFNKPARSKRNRGGGRRSNASQASDDLASERLSDAGSVGFEREPHPLPSKPEWIKNKSIYKNSSTGSRATSISSLNSALSLNMNLGSSAGPSSEASPSKSSSSNFHEVSTASSSAVSPNLPALHWTPAGYAWPRGSSGLASDPLGDEPAQADQLRKPTIVIKSRGDTPEPYRQPGAASLPHSSSSESLSPTQHLAGLQKATSVSQNAPSSREGVIKPTPVRSSSA